MIILKTQVIRAMCLITLAAVVGSASAEQPPPQAKRTAHGSLVGTWVGGSACALVFVKDDGESVEANCDNSGFRHQFKGRYTSSDRLEITITRTDLTTGCKAEAEGFVIVANSNAMDVFQVGWNGCGVKTGPAATHITRAQ